MTIGRSSVARSWRAPGTFYLTVSKLNNRSHHQTNTRPNHSRRSRSRHYRLHTNQTDQDSATGIECRCLAAECAECRRGALEGAWGSWAVKGCVEDYDAGYELWGIFHEYQGLKRLLTPARSKRGVLNGTAIS